MGKRSLESPDMVGNGMNPVPRIRVLLLTSLLGTMGGSEKNVFYLAKHLPAEKFEVFIIALRGGKVLCLLQHLGFYTREIGLKSILSWGGMVKGFRFFGFLRKQKIDILMTYHEDADLWGGIIGWLACVPVRISSKRDMGYQVNALQRIAYRYVNRCFSRFVAVSGAVKHVLNKTQQVPENKIDVIYNGIEVSESSTRQRTRYLHDLLDLPEESVLVGMVASFRPEKGQEFFVEAAARILSHFSDVVFIIVGNTESDYYQKVSDRISELEIGQKVHCLGVRRDISEILGGLDIFVLSSLHEGCSNALLEAMDASLPVIASNSGGNPEIVSAENGILFEPGNVRMLSEAIFRLLGDRTKSIIMGERGKASVRNGMSLKGMIRKYQDLFFSELINAGEVPPLALNIKTEIKIYQSGSLSDSVKNEKLPP